MEIYDFVGLHDMKHTYFDKKLDDIDDIFACYNELYELTFGYSFESKFIEIYKRKSNQKPDNFISLEFNKTKDGDFIFQNAFDFDMRETCPVPKF